jgi:hypothetical protein
MAMERYFWIVVTHHDGKPANRILARSSEGLTRMVAQLAADANVATFSVKPSEDWIGLLRWMRDTKVDAREFEPVLSRALLGAINACDAGEVRRVLSIAAPMVAHYTISRYLDVQMTNKVARLFRGEEFAKIADFYRGLEDGPEKIVESPPRNTPAGNHHSVEREPGFLRDNQALLTRDATGPKRILFIENEFIHHKDEDRLVAGREEEVHQYLIKGAESLGHEVHHLDATGCSYDHSNFKGAEHFLGADDLIDEAISIDPDIIFMDFNYAPVEGGFTPDRLARLRAGTRAALAGFVHDNYPPAGLGKCRYWGQHADLILTVEPSMTYPDDLRPKTNLVFIPIFWNRGAPDRDRQTAYFSGTPRTDRTAYIAALRASGLPATSSFMNRANLESFTTEQYRRNLESHGFVVNSGSRSSIPIDARQQAHIVTARTFETIYAGAILLEKSGSMIDYFFTPGEHYEKFETIDDLVDVVRTLNNEPERRDALAANAQTFMDTHYNARGFWNLVINRLENVR